MQLNPSAVRSARVLEMGLAAGGGGPPPIVWGRDSVVATVQKRGRGAGGRGPMGHGEGLCQEYGRSGPRKAAPRCCTDPLFAEITISANSEVDE